MDLKDKYNSIKLLVLNNKKVIENYFFMTVLQILNSLFYLFIYPFLIRTLGAESFGLYVFSFSIVTYFIAFISFGFDMPAVKIIAEYPNDEEKKSNTLSCVFTAKVFLELFSIFIFALFLFFIPFLQNNWIILIILFSQTLTNILFPQWYFQGVQRMKYVTYIQLLFKLLSLPFIFILIRSSNDLILYAVITSSASLGGGIIAAFIIRYNEKIIIKWMPFIELKKWFKDSFPFFLSSSAGTFKEQSLTIIIGAFFGMKDVAIYDLATKIISIPRLILVSVNGALFPKIMQNFKKGVVNKIIKYQIYVGLMVILFISLLGKWFVLILGGNTMQEAYPFAIVLSVTVLTWIVVGSYISFVFVPNNKYYYVTLNQAIAIISFFTFSCIGLLIFKNAIVMVVALSLSGLTEIIFCRYLIKKDNLLL